MLSATNGTPADLMNVTISTTAANVMKFFFTHIYLLALVVVGCIGNGFVIIVFGQRVLRSKIGAIGSNMSVYPFLFYMAISDNIYLFILFCLWLSNYVNILHRPIICQSTLYLTYVCNFINAYYTVSFTAQRLFAVVQPFHVSHLLSWHRSRCLALGIIVVAVILYSYIPVVVGIVGGYCYSLEKFRSLHAMLDVIDCVIVFLVPYLMIITMNAMILVSLRRMKGLDDPLLFPTTNSHLNKIRELARRRASRTMTRLLLTVSTSYLIICAPYACIHTWRLLWAGESSQSKLARQLEYYFHLIYHISFAMNFYIYIVFGSKFRRELKRFLVKCKVKVLHCLQRRSIDASDTSANRHNSSNFEQFRLLKPNTPCSTQTTSSYTVGYRWRQPSASYI